MFNLFWRLLGFGDFFDKDWFSFPQIPEGPHIPGFDVAHTGAELPESISVSGTFCRWHARSLAPPFTPLWQSFLDDERKWAMQSRFAGPSFNCGHFFALSEEVATSEARHYDIVFSESEILQVKARFDKVLDLTTAAGRKLAFEAVVEGADFSEAFIAEEIIEEVTGGTMLTDRIGQWASRNGYEAVLYVGPRMVWGPETKAVDGHRPRKPWDYDLFPMYEQLFRDDRLNLAVFRGRYVLSRATEFRVGQGQWLRNGLFILTEDQIETELSVFAEYKASDEAFQQAKRRASSFAKISYR